MADLAGLAAAGEALVEKEPPEPPQLPYAADPGTLTHWLVTSYGHFDRHSILATLATMNAKYTYITHPQRTPEQVTSLLKELGEDVVASEGLESFLTITTPTETGKAMVIAVSRLSRFQSGIGETSRLQRKRIWLSGRSGGEPAAPACQVTGQYVAATGPSRS